MGRMGMLLLACTMCSMVLAQNECYDVDTSTVADDPKLALDVCEINSFLAEDPPNWEAARRVYKEGSQGNSLTLFAVATAEYPTALYQKYAVFFGDQTWIHTRIDQALDGEGKFSSNVKRVQAIKKLLQASVLVQRFFYHIDSAVSKTEANNPEGALISLNRAMATFYGGNIDCSPFGNGQARGIEFGTIEDGVSKANMEVHASVKAGAEALMAMMEDSSEDAKDAVKAARDNMLKQVTVIYAQAVFKYATLIDTGLEAEEDVEKSQAEGYAYYLAIYPLVADADPAGAEEILKAFNIATAPDEEAAEQVKDIMRSNYPKLSINEEDVRDFDPEAVDNYVDPEVASCERENPFSTDDSSKPGNVDG